MEAHVCHLSCTGKQNQGITSPGWPWASGETVSQKQPMQKGEHLPNKCKAQSSTPVSEKLKGHKDLISKISCLQPVVDWW
jgi:hypothetical protein